jgi:hypothetical protein
MRQVHVFLKKISEKPEKNPKILIRFGIVENVSLIVTVSLGVKEAVRMPQPFSGPAAPCGGY